MYLLNTNDFIDIRTNLLQWFYSNGRKWIPWKIKPDQSLPNSGESLSPYGIWIAEVMLQQTQLNVVLPYWKRWMLSFPDLSILVKTDEQSILQIWKGLGYYSRARRIHESSKILIDLVGENKVLDPKAWPIELELWMQLPGIGRTTAGSIISSAFDLPSPILDGNVKRILSRLSASKIPINKDQKRLWMLSSKLVPIHNSRNFNQALMDLGAMVCTVRNPICSLCPLQKFCMAYIKYDPMDFPKKEMKKIIPTVEIGIGLVFNDQGKLLIDQRLDSASSMPGMWEFPGGKREINESIEKTIEREINEELGIAVDVREKLLSFNHSFSHKKLHFTVHICKWKSGKPKTLASKKFLWVSADSLSEYPFPSANIKIIDALHDYISIQNSK